MFFASNTASPPKGKKAITIEARRAFVGDLGRETRCSWCEERTVPTLCLLARQDKRPIWTRCVLIQGEMRFSLACHRRPHLPSTLALTLPSLTAILPHSILLTVYHFSYHSWARSREPTCSPTFVWAHFPLCVHVPFLSITPFTIYKTPHHDSFVDARIAMCILYSSEGLPRTFVLPALYIIFRLPSTASLFFAVIECHTNGPNIPPGKRTRPPSRWMSIAAGVTYMYTFTEETTCHRAEAMRTYATCPKEQCEF